MSRRRRRERPAAIRQPSRRDRRRMAEPLDGHMPADLALEIFDDGESMAGLYAAMEMAGFEPGDEAEFYDAAGALDDEP